MRQGEAIGILENHVRRDVEPPAIDDKVDVVARFLIDVGGYDVQPIPVVVKVGHTRRDRTVVRMGIAEMEITIREDRRVIEPDVVGSPPAAVAPVHFDGLARAVPVKSASLGIVKQHESSLPVVQRVGMLEER